jgi:cytochrome P450
MTKRPEIQARAQEEIDRVVGMKRLPSLPDRPNLPYVEALTSEILCCGSVFPFAIPHKLRIDDVHNRYYIPKGTIVLPNTWYINDIFGLLSLILKPKPRFMSSDPRYYKNPKVFNPSRFLDPHPETDPRKWMFGFGRRACAGMIDGITNNVRYAILT